MSIALKPWISVELIMLELKLLKLSLSKLTLPGYMLRIPRAHLLINGKSDILASYLTPLTSTSTLSPIKACPELM